MKPAEIINSVIGGVAVILLAAIGRGLLGVRKDFRRFMTEHAWLIATTLWTRDKVMQVMARMDMPVDGQPPSDLPRLAGAPDQAAEGGPLDRVDDDERPPRRAEVEFVGAVFAAGDREAADRLGPNNDGQGMSSHISPSTCGTSSGRVPVTGS